MRQLALETSGTSGSVAALVDDDLLAELTLPLDQRSGRSLAPAMDRLLKQIDWKPLDVELVSVTVGPGSFTGLRIGVTTAKTFAYAVEAQVLAVDTLDVLAEQADVGSVRLEVVFAAERGQLFWARYLADEQRHLRREGPCRLVDQEEWLASLTAGVVVTGPPIEKLAPRLPVGVVPVDPARRFPTAATVGRLAARRFAAGQRDNLWQLVPNYGRPSAAEEKWNAGRGAGPELRG